MKTAVKWVAMGAGLGCASLVARAMVGNAAGVVAAVLSDFEAKRTEVPVSPVGIRRTTRTPSAKLPSRLQADIDYVRSASSNRTISLVEAPAPVSR